MKLIRLPRQSGGGPPQSKTLARFRATLGIRGPFWSAPAEQLRRRRFRIIREVQLSAHAPKRCRASLATAVQNTGAAVVSRFGHSLTQ